MKRVCFIYRRDADTPSIERVFRIVSNELKNEGIEVSHVRLPFGNNFGGIVANLLFFRVPEADVLHITGHVNYIALRLPVSKTVLTVHDLGVLRHRTGLRHRMIKSLFFDWPFKRVRFLTAISAATKVEMIKSTDCEPEKITVIHDPADPVMESGVKPFNTGKPVILQVGTASHKNLERLIDAVKGIQCRLMIVGVLNNKLRNKLKAFQIEFESLTADTDNAMRAIYQRCDLVAFCSTFEGFGLPIIEAQSMGIPLITSDIPPMNEVAGKGAILVDPLDTAQIRNAIESLIRDPALRRNLVAEGKKNLPRFDATKIAREYLDLYERMEVNA